MFQSAPGDCSPGDARVALEWEEMIEFQSAPGDCSPGDEMRAPNSRVSMSFNPRPAIARRATDTGAQTVPEVQFQSAPGDCSPGDTG